MDMDKVPDLDWVLIRTLSERWCDMDKPLGSHWGDAIKFGIKSENPATRWERATQSALMKGIKRWNR